MVINGYNIAAEIVTLIVVCLMIFFAYTTKPKQTRILRIVKAGFICSAAHIVVHILLICGLSYSEYFASPLYYVLTAGYFLLHLSILNLIFSYVHLLSNRNQHERLMLNSISMIMFASYIIVIGYFLMSGKMFAFDENGQPMLTGAFNYYLFFGFLCMIYVLFSMYVNRKHLPKVFMRFLLVFIPIEVLLIVTQLYQPYVIILGVTVSMPFVLFYIMFHSIHFDEATGCQDADAFLSHYFQLMHFKRFFHVVYITFPRLQQIENQEINNAMEDLVKKACHDLDKMSADTSVYRINDYTFALVLSIAEESVAKEAITRVYNYMERAIFAWDKTKSPEYKMIAFRSHPYIKTEEELRSFGLYLWDRILESKGRCYIASSEDYEEATKRHYIEKELADISAKCDLDDPRIIVYVQPIYNVVTKQFMTAEALMRMEYQGEILSPYVFIPIAERNGYIHSLTCIILNKVCKAIHEIQNDYWFDAISVNVSTSELADYRLHEELIKIINDNQVDCSKIRLELTESAMLSDIDTVSFNMEKLTEAGVTFYLDDFGTGYSNLERIVSLPFSTVKFDKSLLYKALDNETLDNLMESLVGVFKKHDLVVLAEGVEDEIQAKYSIDAGFDFIQGYNYAKPVPIERLAEFLTKK